MKHEEELIKKAIQKNMPDKYTVLNHCILASEKEEKENLSMKNKIFSPKKLIVVSLVVVGILGASTVSYAATGNTLFQNVRFFINGEEVDGDEHLIDNPDGTKTYHFEAEDGNSSTDITLEPDAGYDADVHMDGNEVQVEIREGEGSVFVTETGVAAEEEDSATLQETPEK